jgi:hypothetical protein
MAVLASLFWIGILIAALADEGFREDLDRELDNSDTIRAGLQIAGAAARLVLG